MCLQISQRHDCERGYRRGVDQWRRVHRPFSLNPCRYVKLIVGSIVPGTKHGFFDVPGTREPTVELWLWSCKFEPLSRSYPSDRCPYCKRWEHGRGGDIFLLHFVCSAKFFLIAKMLAQLVTEKNPVRDSIHVLSTYSVPSYTRDGLSSLEDQAVRHLKQSADCIYKCSRIFFFIQTVVALSENDYFASF